MKQSKINNYIPKYPRKLVRGTALAAAALMSLGAAGCITVKKSASPLNRPADEQTPATEQPEDLTISGDIEYVIPDDLMEMGEPCIEDDPPVLGGEPLPYDFPEEEEEEDDIREEPALMGKIAVFDEPEEP